jgi:hypothetical protein
MYLKMLKSQLTPKNLMFLMNQPNLKNHLFLKLLMNQRLPIYPNYPLYPMNR